MHFYLPTLPAETIAKDFGYIRAGVPAEGCLSDKAVTANIDLFRAARTAAPGDQVDRHRDQRVSGRERNARRARRPVDARAASPAVAAAAASAVRIEGLRVDFERAGVTGPRRRRPGPGGARARVPGYRRPQRLRQVDAAQRARRHAAPHRAAAVWVDGAPVVGINRSLGYVTQEDNLLPWRTLLGNIELPLELRGRAARGAP